ncbi:hypothetical protein JRQ81_014699 [Phrynocephalus forsythii]|uniref:Uncharacterized protein n=1 Tax=Phrynocephalus forsythii TaxID=171643 RepID=A0A9Q1B3Q4_9SAUR|nr:hypothetical protein JRQ81_014699 [Phrynocephalus forsythii]
MNDSRCEKKSGQKNFAASIDLSWHWLQICSSKSGRKQMWIKILMHTYDGEITSE